MNSQLQVLFNQENEMVNDINFYLKFPLKNVFKKINKN